MSAERKSVPRIPDEVLAMGPAEAAAWFEAHPPQSPEDEWEWGMAKLDLERPIPTPAERARSAQMGRLACVLQDMRERSVDPKLGEEALHWHEREDFEALLQAWEAGHHSAQQARG